MLGSGQAEGWEKEGAGSQPLWTDLRMERKEREESRERERRRRGRREGKRPKENKDRQRWVIDGERDRE